MTTPKKLPMTNTKCVRTKVPRFNRNWVSGGTGFSSDSKTVANCGSTKKINAFSTRNVTPHKTIGYISIDQTVLLSRKSPRIK